MQVDPQPHEEDILSQGVERTFEFFKEVSRFFETLASDQNKDESHETSAHDSPANKNHPRPRAWEASGHTETHRDEWINVSLLDTFLESSPESKVRER